MAEVNVTNLTTDVDIKGTIKFDKVMKIEGKFEGELISNEGELIVGKTGAIKANVKVKNASIKGRIKFDKVMKIEGKFEGELISNEGELIVGKTGAIKANVKVKNASIEGRVDGN